LQEDNAKNKQFVYVSFVMTLTSDLLTVWPQICSPS